MSKIKTIITELRPNIVWDLAKIVLFWLGGAVMSTGLIATFLVLFSGAWLNWIIIIGLFLLSLVLIAIAFLIGNANTNNVNLPNFPDEPLVEIRNRTYANDKVLLDGFDYIDCTFINVKFIYNGTASVGFSHNTMQGSVLFSSESMSIQTTASLLKGLGIIKPEIPVFDDNHKPLDRVNPPKFMSSDEDDDKKPDKDAG